MCLSERACLGLDLKRDFIHFSQFYYSSGVASFKSSFKKITLGLEFELGNVNVTLKALCVSTCVLMNFLSSQLLAMCASH